MIHPNQYCGVPVESVFEAVAAVLDAITQAEIFQKPLCALSIDFSAALDKISHEYIYIWH